MTKVTILGQEPKEEKKLKPIEFVKYYNNESMSFKDNNHNNICVPSDFENIELLSRNFSKGLDLMFVYREDRNSTFNSMLYLGHFNDGVV